MRKITPLLTALSALTLAPAAQADNIADCEILLMELIEDDLGGGMQVASYRPAMDYIMSVYDDEPGHIDKIDTLPIRALMCQRNDVIPIDKDYALLATGIPFILSQDFDSTDTDTMTIYWKDDALDYVYKGFPLTDDTKTKLEARLADFTARGITANK